LGYKYIGDSNQLCFQFESGAYASASGARQWIGLVQDHTAKEGVGVDPIRFQGNYSRNVGLFTDGKLEYTGKFTFYPQDWRFLSFAIGSCQVLTGSKIITESDSNASNYAVPAQILSSFTLEDSKKTASTGSNFIRTYKGCMVDTLKLTMKEGAIAACDIDYKAQQAVYSSGTVTSVTAIGSKPYMWSNTTIHLPSGTKLQNCIDYTLTIKNNLESRFPLNGSRTIETVIPLARDYDVKASFIMDSANASDLYNTYYIQGTSFNSMAELKSTNGSLYIVMSGCRITDMTVPSPVQGLQEQTCTIMPTSINANVYDSVGGYTAW